MAQAIAEVKPEETNESDKILKQLRELKEMEVRILAAVRKELSPQSRRENEHKKVFHNTKKLLRNYSKFVEHYKQTEFVSSTLIDEDILEIINYRMDDDNIDDTYIKSLFKTKERTATILNHVNKVIQFMERTADTKKKQRIIEVIKMTYIEGRTAEEVAEAIGIDRSTVFKDLNIGVEEIGPLLFGIDGLRLE